MRCPTCKYKRTNPYKTLSHYNDITIRLRGCPNCGTVFKTIETIDKETIRENVFVQSLLDKSDVTMLQRNNNL